MIQKRKAVGKKASGTRKHHAVGKTSAARRKPAVKAAAKRTRPAAAKKPATKAASKKPEVVVQPAPAAVVPQAPSIGEQPQVAPQVPAVK
jgi:hypothetical protein